VVCAVNGRWALQVSVGHSWHMQYAWLPLVLYFFDLSLEPGRQLTAVAAGWVLGIMAYMGGIYPLPHAALLLTLYAAMTAAVERSWEPVRALAVASLSGVGFSAPKLFPMIELMRRYPRKIDSVEAIDLGQLTAMLVDPSQSYARPPVAVPFWRWHEYGIYVGGWVVLAMVIGVACARAAKTVPLRLGGLVFFLLGMGAFHPQAPWTQLHRMPVFSSQHIPTRFLFPAVLLLMLAFASFVGGYIDRIVISKTWVDLLLMIPVYMVAVDVATVGRKSTEHSFFMQAPKIEPSPQFRHQTASPYDYTPGDVTGASLLAMFANVGVIGSYGLPALAPGAIAQSSPSYRGEAYLVGPDEEGNATVVRWTPSTAVVEYAGARPGSLLVYNMNYDPGWNADGRPAVDYHHAVAIRIADSRGRVTFSYRPCALFWGLAAFALTLGLTFSFVSCLVRGRLAR